MTFVHSGIRSMWFLFTTVWRFLVSFYRPQRSWGKVIFSEACVHILSTGRACVVARGGMHSCSQGGHVVASEGTCVVALGGGMCGCSGGVCGEGGHAWWRGMCGEGGVHGKGGIHGEGGVHGKGGHVWQRGMCGEGGVHGKGGHTWWRGCAWWRGHVWQRGACMAKGSILACTPPPDTAGHCVGGTHPTGMHSCFMNHSNLFFQKEEILVQLDKLAFQ